MYVCVLYNMGVIPIYFFPFFMKFISILSFLIRFKYWNVYVCVFAALFATGGQDNTVLIHSLKPEVEGKPLVCSLFKMWFSDYSI